MRQTILITGASSGLGAGLAHEFAARGRSLALCARRLHRLEELRTELLADHPDATVAIKALDVTDAAAVGEVVSAFAAELDGLDRVIVNAGLGKGAPLGTGYARANAQTAQTNFVGALAQCEAAMAHFRSRGRGHLVVMSSAVAARGVRGAMTSYAASKAGVATLAEGIRSDVWGTDIVVTTLFPGYIASEMTARAKHTPFLISAERGARLLAAAIEREPTRAVVPWWPWRPYMSLMRVLPLGLARRLG